MNKTFVFAFITFCALTFGVQAKVTLQWWQFWTDPEIKPTVENIVRAFESANPDIKVEITDLTWANGQEKITIAFASGTGPDIVEIGSDWIAKFASNGQLADISSHVATDSGQFQGWGMSTYEGKVYARPWILGTRVLFLNRDIIQRAGYDSNFVPVDINEFTTAVFKIGNLGSGVYGWGSNTAEKHRLYKKFLPFFWTFGGQFFTSDGKYCVLASDFGIQALKTYKALHDSSGFIGTQREIEDAFLAGKVGFIMSGDWLLKRIKLERSRINFNTTLFPGQRYPGRSFLGGEFLAINEKSEHRSEALKFVDFVTSPENQVLFCKASSSSSPSSKVAQKDPYFASDIHMLTFIRQLRMANHPPVDPNWSSMESAIEKAVEDALFGEGLPASALYNAQRTITEIGKANAAP